ncbi:ribonucleoside-diphosphate reductase large subunit [Lactuca sativa]|uniref:ribonucleoside-diphosphate reductase large subunit n=1 Tax=Lactuca sativa TaxID=4236 RepID=UPI000CD8101D|nr:ribonucleoside-diphosphate reductase large subunit [Lactuca sativa]
MSLVKIDFNRKIVNPVDIIAKLEKYNTGLTCDLVLISNKICERGVYQHVTSELVAEIAASMAANHPDYISLATKIDQANVREIWVERSLSLPPFVTYEVYNTITKHAKELEAKIVPERDDYYDYIGLKILERSYLLKINGRVVESPQHMLMRVAIGIHKDDIDSVIQTYQMMSEGWFTHASPTLFNAGTPNSQLSSCIMICMVNNSIGRTYDILKECAVVSKSAGGIGVSLHNVGSTGGTNEEQRALDLSYALWVPDLFMERVQSNGSWSLANCWGEDFVKLYEQYEAEPRLTKEMHVLEIGPYQRNE